MYLLMPCKYPDNQRIIFHSRYTINSLTVPLTFNIFVQKNVCFDSLLRLDHLLADPINPVCGRVGRPEGTVGGGGGLTRHYGTHYCPSSHHCGTCCRPNPRTNCFHTSHLPRGRLLDVRDDSFYGTTSLFRLKARLHLYFRHN